AAIPRDAELRFRGIDAPDQVHPSAPGQVDRGLRGAVLEDRHADVGAAGLWRQADVATAGEIDPVAAAGRGVVDHHAGAGDASLARDREAAALEVVEAGEQGDGARTGDLDAAHVGARR